MLATAGCGGSLDTTDSGRPLAAACKRQAALLERAGNPADLAQAGNALRLTIGVERALAAALARNGGSSDLVAALRGAQASASRVLASIERTDPQQSMSPLRTGAASSRRAVAAARGLLREACGSATRRTAG